MHIISLTSSYSDDGDRLFPRLLLEHTNKNTAHAFYEINFALIGMLKKQEYRSEAQINNKSNAVICCLLNRASPMFVLAHYSI
jgi:hypothetical protein